MSAFTPIQVKGIDRVLQETSIPLDRLHMHISEIEPGTRAHPPHTHAGVEAFYVLEGEGVLEVHGVRYPLKANEAVVLDPGVIHRLENTGISRMKYMVILASAG